MRSNNLNFDDSPPLSVVMPFFVTALLFVVGAAGLLALRPATILSSIWMPETVALAHTGTVGFLLMTMIGALYQMSPVVAGASVRALRLAHVVHLLLIVGGLGFVAAGLSSSGAAFAHSGSVLALAIVLFIVPTGTALFQSPTPGVTVWGMRLAIVSVLLVGAVGVFMAQAYIGHGLQLSREALMQFHLSMGLLCWVGGLIMAVSWQVIPMFYLAAPFDERKKRALLAAMAVSLVLLPIALLLPEKAQFLQAKWLLASAALPAALSAWLAHPLVIFKALKARKRRRPDASLNFWKMGLMSGPLCLISAVLALALDEPRFGLAFGWCVIWMWAGAIVHGMLHRIVPFLVWLHWFADLAGRGHLPTTRSLLPNVRSQRSYWLHLATSVTGLLAILWPQAPLVFLMALMLSASAINSLVAFFLVRKSGRKAKSILSEREPDWMRKQAEAAGETH